MPDPEKKYDLSPHRKQTFYVGLALTAIGFITFISVFISAAMNFGDFDHFDERGRSMGIRAVGGMILMIVGGIVTNVGRSGAAGAGFVPDPRKMRQDLEPWNRAAGGMASDTLDEVGAVQKFVDRESTGGGTQVKVRCPQCKALNDENAHFCSSCGHALQ